MSFSVYILYSPSCKKFYTGQTQDFDNRLTEHNSGEAKSLKPCIPWKVLWKTQVPTRTEAMILERKIKSMGAARYLADLGITIPSRIAWRLGAKIVSSHAKRVVATPTLRKAFLRNQEGFFSTH